MYTGKENSNEDNGSPHSRAMQQLQQTLQQGRIAEKQQQQRQINGVAEQRSGSSKAPDHKVGTAAAEQQQQTVWSSRVAQWQGRSEPHWQLQQQQSMWSCMNVILK